MENRRIVKKPLTHCSQQSKQKPSHINNFTPQEVKLLYLTCTASYLLDCLKPNFVGLNMAAKIKQFTCTAVKSANRSKDHSCYLPWYRLLILNKNILRNQHKQNKKKFSNGVCHYVTFEL